MSRTDLWAASAFLLIGAISLAWGWWQVRPYWSVLSLLALAWASWRLLTRRKVSTASWSAGAASLAAVPLLGALAGPSSWLLLEGFIAPVLLYSLALSTVTASEATEQCGSRALALLAFLMALSVGTVALLSLYYLDTIFASSLVPSNSDLMWPLATLFIGSLTIMLGLRVSGLEEVVLGREEALG